MKKSVIAIILIVFFGYSYGQKISGGLVVSPIVSWMKPDITKSIETEKAKFGFNYGIVGDFNFTENFAFSTGILVNNYGGSLKYTEGDSIHFKTSEDTYLVDSAKFPAIVDYKLQYVEIPIALKGKTNEIGYITYFLKAGISPGFRWKAKGDVNGGSLVNGESIKDEVRGTVIAFNVGGGIEYSLGGNTKVLAEIIYNNGLTGVTKTEVFKDGETEATNDKVILNHVALKIGILF